MVADFRILRGSHRAVRLCRPGAHRLIFFPAFIARAQLAGQRVRTRLRVRVTVAFAARESVHLRRSHHLGTGIIARRDLLRFPLATGRGQRPDRCTAGILVLCWRRSTLPSDVWRAFYLYRAISCSRITARESSN